VREVLRAATREAHLQVDACFARFDLACPQGYRAFLGVHGAALPRCEACLDSSGVEGLIADWPRRRRGGALLDDLAQLCVPPPAAPPPLHRLSAAEMFGMLYVLEGSRMGGAVLAARVRGNTDACCRLATRYLLHGAGQGLWPSFLAALEDSGSVRDDIDAAVAAALATFAVFSASVRWRAT